METITKTIALAVAVCLTVGGCSGNVVNFGDNNDGKAESDNSDSFNPEIDLKSEVDVGDKNNSNNSNSNNIKSEQRTTDGKNNTEVGKESIAGDASEEEKTNNGKTQLGIAIEKCDGKKIKIQLDNGADPYAKNNNGETPISIAIKSCVKAIEIIIAKKIALNKKNDNGDIPLHLAAKEQNDEAVKIFLAARGGGPYNVAGLNPEDIINSRSFVPAFDVNEKNNEGNTPLHLAAAGKNADIVRSLLQSGADVSAINNEGKTPLQVAEDAAGGSLIDSSEIYKILCAADQNCKLGHELSIPGFNLPFNNSTLPLPKFNIPVPSE